jgi:DNA-binding transcriptional LysR family regulator
MSMELHQLAYAEAIADEGSFTRAANRLHVAQPTLSRAIRLLERELGVVLFHRAPGHAAVGLTQEGAALLPFLHRVLADVEDAEAEARSLIGMATGRLVIGATPSLATRLLPPVLAEYHAAFPGVELSLVEARSRDLTALVTDGRVDLGIVVLPVHSPRVVTAVLFDDPLVIALRSDHALAGRARIRLRELDQLPIVAFSNGYDLRAVTDEACRRNGVQPRTAVEGGEMDGVLALVAAGLGVAVVPAIALDPNGPVRSVPLAQPRLHRTIALARRSDRPAGHAARELERRLLLTCRSRRRPLAT